MAPVGMVGMLGWASSPEVGIISAVAFLVLSITLVALCTRCRRSSGNGYDVNGTMGSGRGGGGGGANMNAGTKTGEVADPGAAAYSNWRDHKMPPSTLDRSTNSPEH